jgi:hypothetical protein
MEVTPIRGFFLVGAAISFIVFSADGCKYVVGAMNAFAGEYNDAYTDMNDDSEVETDKTKAPEGHTMESRKDR